MTEKQLTFNQQLALLPATVPDSLIDFLEDLAQETALQSETARAAFDADFLKSDGERLKGEMEGLRKSLGKPTKVEIEAGGREFPGGFLIKVHFEQGARGIAAHTKMKERTIFKLQMQPGEYSADGLKQLLKGTP